MNLPGRIWRGRPNPLALPSAEPNPSNAYGLTLGSNAEDTLKRALGNHAPQETASKGAVSGRASGMFISFDGAAEVARCSPGDLLVARVIAMQCERGRAVFDLGVGQARYKSSFCGEVDELFTLILPVTARGRVYAGAVRSLVSVKRLVKQTPWALRAVGALRAARAKLRA